MRFVVCIKQVPVVSSLKFDFERRTVVREGVINEVNSYDVLAVAEAVALRERLGGEVVVLTMGPPQAKDALVFCLAAGADRAVHLCDPAFARSDTLATARALSAAIRRIGFDLVLCGRHSVDAETGQVGPEIAELLGVPFVSSVRKLSLDTASGPVRAEQQTDFGRAEVECSLPAVMSVAENLNDGVWPTKKQRIAALERPLEVWTPRDLAMAPALLGEGGSPTWVTELTAAPSTRAAEVFSGPVDEQVAAAARRLANYGLFGEWQDGRSDAPPPDSISASTNRTVLVCVERWEENLRPVSFELIAGAREIAQRVDGDVAALLFWKNERHVQELAAAGADAVIVADSGTADDPAGAHVAALTAAIERYRPWAVLGPSTTLGREYMPRVAARLGLGLTGDCIGLDLDGEGRLLQLKPAFGGAIVAPILSRTEPNMATLRPGMQARPPANPRRVARVEHLTVPTESVRVRVLAEQAEAGLASVALENAEIVIGVGMGVGGPDGMEPVEALAGTLGAALGASRNVTDLGWMPKSLQVGLTGRAIGPKLYIAVAINGDFNHMVGVRRAGRILAVNSNPHAPVFAQCDWGIVGDYREVLPRLNARLAELRRAGGAPRA